MLHTYLPYTLTLLSSLSVFYTFGVFSTAAAGYTLVPFISFLASIILFGLGSWIFLHFPKPGKIVAIALLTILLIWPVSVLGNTLLRDQWPFDSMMYFIPITVLAAAPLYFHIKSLNKYIRPKRITRIILTAIPLTVFLLYVAHIVRMIAIGKITIS